MKRIPLIAVIGFVGILCFAAFALLFGDTCAKYYYTVFPKQCTITTEEITCGESVYNPANNHQTGANVWLGADNGKLYFFPAHYSDVSQQTKFYQHLSVFEDHTATRLTKLDGSIIGIQDGYVYYRTWPYTDGTVNEYSIYSYNTFDDSEILLFSSTNSRAEGYFSSTGTFYIPADESGVTFYPVVGNSINRQPKIKESYEINGRLYSIEGFTFSQVISCTDEQGNITYMDDAIPQGRKSVIPCKEGLLIHNEGQGELLYLICADTNEVIELFTVPCHFSRSTVNIHGSSVFLSFSRSQFDVSGDFTIPFENDTLSGTYRIDLKNYSSTKISDSVYTGLYIFDDSGIYACDNNCHIYKLDFDGNVIMTLLG